MGPLVIDLEEIVSRASTVDTAIAIIEEQRVERSE